MFLEFRTGMPPPKDDPASETKILNVGAVTSTNVTGLVAGMSYTFLIIPYNVVDDGGAIEETYHYNTMTPASATISTPDEVFRDRFEPTYPAGLAVSQQEGW
jgi:hypothetical protein